MLSPYPLNPGMKAAKLLLKVSLTQSITFLSIKMWNENPTDTAFMWGTN